MAEIFGLDFGTTNTLVALHTSADDRVQHFLDDGRPHPSVVRYHGSTVTAGRAAREQLEGPSIGVVGDFVRSPKRFLGRGLDIYVGGVARNPSEVVADILRHVRNHAISQLPRQVTFGNVVATIPVAMDARGRRALREAARLAGFDIYQFVHEPLAALYGYIRRMQDFQRRMAELEGRLVLVFDWGGGTLDLTLCRVTDGSLIQVHNIGDDSIGGDRFDERIMRLVEDRHRSQNGLSTDPVLIPGARAKLNTACELAKIRLSRESAASILVAHFADEVGAARTLEQQVSREDIESCTRDLVDAGIRRIRDTLSYAGVSAEAVEVCLAIGGMVHMPAIRSRLIAEFGGPGRVPLVEHGDRMIAEGAAWIAADQQPLTLAKPFELLHADDAYVPLMDARHHLPTIGTTTVTKFAMYCVDPRDGYARFLFARPSSPDRTSALDRRSPYAVAVLAVDPNARPLLERLDVQLAVDEDLVMRVDLTSSLVGDRKQVEIHDLEFGLRLGRR
jgi:molecular chaperone DnaK (HSP70)